MRKIKYIISFLVIFLVLLFNGESFQFYISDIESQYYNTSLYLPDYEKPDEMIQDIKNTANKYDVEIFAVVENIKNAFYTEKTFFCDEKTKYDIQKKNDIEEKKYISVFSGITDIKFKLLEEIENIANVNEYYLIGATDDIQQFKMDLIDKYGGNHPQEGYEDSGVLVTSILLWMIAGIIILILSFYHVIYQKKENFIKISLGQNINALIVKNIILDAIIYCMMFCVAFFILRFYTSVKFHIKISIYFLVAIVFLNSILFLTLKFYDIKKVLSNAIVSKKLLFMNYVLKVISCIITITIVSGNILIIANSLEFYSQKEFFKKYEKYSYVHLDYKLRLNEEGTVEDKIKESTIVREKFYRKFFKKFNAILLAQLTFDDEKNIMIANKNAFDYLKENISELNSKVGNKEIYFIIPDKYRKNNELIEELKNWVRNFEGKSFSFDFDIIYYKNNASLIAINEQNFNGSTYLSKPIIIYNNLDASVANYKIDTEWFKNSYEYDIMYHLDNQQLQKFIEDNNLLGEIHSTTNVFENYMYHWNILKRSMYISVVLSLLILCLEYIVIKYIIKLEYEANAIELSIKKVLGYSLWQKNGKILILTLITSLTSISIACIMGIFFKISETKFIIVGGLLITVLELTAILSSIKKLEKTNIQKILKGGSL